MAPSDSVISYLFINAGSEHMLGSFTSVWKWRESNFTLILWTANSKGDQKIVAIGELCVTLSHGFMFHDGKQHLW